MSGALYRKYRSTNFNEIIGQQHIVTTLANSIKNGSFAHAYLLTGPRGVGKTSIARLFAYQVNGINYEENENYSDIIEIDAASNRRIDEIRELREKINIAPSLLKYKVYIIDEVHMLTREAFNALLKTLEEPPEHAIFVLATTDAHKVPGTIVSRCIKFNFAPISTSDIASHLKNVAKKESIPINDKALEMIADNARGSFRDSLSLLDQFRNSGQKEISGEYVAATLGVGADDLINKLMKAVENSQPQEIISILNDLRSNGADDAQLAKQLLQWLRKRLLGAEQTTLTHEAVISLSNELLKLNTYIDQGLALELALLSIAGDVKNKPANSATESSANIKETPSPKKSAKPEPEQPDIPKKSLKKADDIWLNILDELKEVNRTLYGIARMAEAEYEDDKIRLHFEFPFHFKQINIEKNKQLLEQIASSLKGNQTIIEILLSEKTSKPTPVKPTYNNSRQSVANISNIFGPSEVLES